MLQVVSVTEDLDIILSQSKRAPPCLARGRSLAYMLFTSGSTGQPKGTPILSTGCDMRSSNVLFCCAESISFRQAA